MGRWRSYDEARNPKAEGRKQAEARIPNAAGAGDVVPVGVQVHGGRGAMKYSIRSPKAEVRRPKEGREPKSERSSGNVDIRSEYWSWGDEPNAESLALRDGSEDPPGPADLMERTAQFGENIIRFAKKIPRVPGNNRLIDQLVGAGTSVGANYCEADDAVSGKEFKQKIGICRKESKESMFFLRMVAAAEQDLATEARGLWREAKELNLIFGAIWRK
jgi:four helix bundle protein